MTLIDRLGAALPRAPVTVEVDDIQATVLRYRPIFISAKAMATLEFLQQEWVNNGNFMSLGEERDPNVGLQADGATFTIPQEPVRRRVHGIETFNVLRGGEYFFMPSLSALRWLADAQEGQGS